MRLILIRISKATCGFRLMLIISRVIGGESVTDDGHLGELRLKLLFVEIQFFLAA